MLCLVSIQVELIIYKVSQEWGQSNFGCSTISLFLSQAQLAAA